MLTIQAIIDNKIKEVCPIYGISIKDINDNTTWSICFDPKATKEQKQSAQNVLDSYTYEQLESLVQADKDAKALLKDTDIKILRHIEELALNQTPYLSTTEYTNLLKQRQEARTKLLGV